MTTPASDNLHLSVTNFGPIARADIDLRPLTVFVGPGNTGKSYLATLIYALHKFFSGKAMNISFPSYPELHSVFQLGPYSRAGNSISPDDADYLVNWLSDALSGGGRGRRQGAIDLALPEPAAKLVRPLLMDIVEYGPVLDDEIARCFGAENTSGLVRNRVAKGSRIEATRPIVGANGAPASIQYCLTMRRKHRDFTPDMPVDAPLRLQASSEWRAEILRELARLRSIRQDDAEDDDDFVFAAKFLFEQLADAIGQRVIDPLNRAAHYLPAERAGLARSHDVIVKSILAQDERAEFDPDTPPPRLSSVLVEFMQQLVDLEDLSPNDGEQPGLSLARRIEKEILKGEIAQGEFLAPGTSMPLSVFLYAPEGAKTYIKLAHTSAMVSELAPVVLYLRHVVRPGETLIIEEPESHLHPDAQVEFTRQLAAIALAGVRVIITTHSELVLEELANLVRLSDLPKSRRKGIGGAPYALNHDQLGVVAVRA